MDAHPFGHFLVQEWLMDDHLGPYRAEIADAPRDVVGRAALLWKCLYGTLFTYLEKNPGWHVRSHEELSGNPAGGLRGLYEALGLEWTAGVEDGMARHTRNGNSVSAPRGRFTSCGGTALRASPSGMAS